MFALSYVSKIFMTKLNPNTHWFKSVYLMCFFAMSPNGHADNIKLHKFGIGDHARLCVPESDMDLRLLEYNNESTNLKPLPGWTPGFGFLFDGFRMQKYFPTYYVTPGFPGHPYANNLSGTLGFLDAPDRSKYGPSMRARNTDLIWRSFGLCAHSTITPLENGLYKAECAKGDDYASIWNQKPDLSSDMPKPDSFIVATCRYEVISEGIYSGRSLQTCSRVITSGDFIVDYRFQEKNIGLVKNFDEMLLNKISEWEKNCLNYP